MKRLSDDVSLYALKIVLSKTVIIGNLIDDEVHYMKTAYDRVPNAVMQIISGAESGELLRGGRYGGYLMAEVGEPVKYLSQKLPQVLLTLQSLHAHQLHIAMPG
mgnify:CR=1 FL=1